MHVTLAQGLNNNNYDKCDILSVVVAGTIFHASPHKLPRIRPEWSLCNFVEQICCLYDLIKVEKVRQ